jgi:hypothetical protein
MMMVTASNYAFLYADNKSSRIIGIGDGAVPMEPRCLCVYLLNIDTHSLHVGD